MIKTSSHSIQFLNINKKTKYIEFRNDCFASLNFYIEHIWNTYHNAPSIPKYLPDAKSLKPINTKLSARMLKCLATQAMGIVKSTIIKNQKISYVNTKYNKSLKLSEISKPIINKNISYEINSICCDFIETRGHFDGFIQLKSIGKYYGKIKIPVKYHRHAIKMKTNGGILKNSFLFRDNFIDFRWELTEINKKKDGLIIGVDQGINSVITLSDGQKSNKDPHGYDYKAIIEKLSRKKKGSRSFRRAQIQRDNYINWCINQLDFTGIKEIRYEKIFNLRKNKNVSRKLSHFNYTTIKTKIKDKCLMNGVHFIEQDNRFRSQRCFNCGYVHKYNRKGEFFKCRSCGHTGDADFNAALNHSIDLPEIPSYIWQHKMNLSGFHWKVVGSAFTVPNEPKVM